VLLAPFFISILKNLYLDIEEHTMLIIQKGQFNELTLNINNNSRETFTGYTMEFTHIMSQEVKTYTVDIANPAQYFANIRYCELALPLNTDDLNYEGQYQLKIYGDGTDLVYVGMALLEGSEETPFFTTYVSDNEVNENYIYIQ
jgi:hypothetical protein